MITTKIGFAGIEVVDTIMYLANICKHLGKKVVVIDCSQEEAFEYYIPVHNEIDMSKDCVSYCGVDFTKKKLSKSEKEDYDIALIYTDYQKMPSQFSEYTHMIVSVDMSKSSFKRIQEISFPNCKYTLLTVRNVISGSINIRPYIREALDYLKTNEVFIQHMNLSDLRALYKCQYNDRFNFKGISNDMLDYLELLIKVIYPKVESKDLKLAIKNAQKGK